ncbi:MAG: Fic family protein [Campylobacterales bacterium]
MKIDVDKLNAFDVGFTLTPDIEYYTFLAKKDRVDYIYNTSSLEGNPMTYPEVQTLLEGITVGGHKLSDERMILNQNRSVELLFDMLKNCEFRVDKSTFCKLHSKVSEEEALKWGEFRDGDVNIGGTEYKPPTYKNLESVFEDGVKKISQLLNPIIKAICFFLFGAKNQFFYDGNKRTSRLMMNGILLSSGYPILNIKAKDKLEFNTKMIEFYEGDECIGTLEYLAHYYREQNERLVRG